MGSLRSDDNPFSPGKGLGCIKNFALVEGHGPHYTVIHKPGDNRGVSMVAETPRMDGGRDKVMAQREHLEEWSVTGFICKVVRE